MKIQLASQPYAGGFTLQRFLHAATEERFDTLTLISAWVRRAGISKVFSPLSTFRARGGHVRAIVGIDLGGTTREGLEDLIAYSDEAFVFHLSGKTFHPKMYMAEGPDVSLAFIGSHNLTAGGMSLNFETATVVEGDLRDASDRSFHDACRLYVEGLLADSGCCLPLTEDLIEQLVANPRYLVPNEMDATRSGDRSGPLSREAEAAPRVFGASNRAMGSAGPSDPARIPGMDGIAGGDLGLRRWSKQLKQADAQQLATAHPTNTVTLVQAGHDIDPSSYFRHTFFGDLAWDSAMTRAAKPRERETAAIEGHVTIDGVSMGTYAFTLRHTPGYEAGQNNRTTELVWGDLASYLRDNDMTGRYLTLERHADGCLKVYIQEAPAGDFVT